MEWRIAKPYYDVGGRKYIDLMNASGAVMCVKVPFRYGRVMCKVESPQVRPVQDFEAGTLVNALIEHKMWDGLKYHVLRSIRELPS
jgi:hypothetical protein